jgi:hypothetical protein
MPALTDDDVKSTVAIAKPAARSNGAELLEREDLLARFRVARSVLHGAHTLAAMSGLGIESITFIAELAWEPLECVMDALAAGDHVAFELHLGAFEIGAEAYGRFVVEHFGGGAAAMAVH